ncbi:MAG: hypothetical protein DRO00_01075 [Thermoproteota archaeon]|mgnify:CR=1 FL=1|nr:MAG: hypothetical protein DRO00_01075 [Candidatus Korarchaeota archaeon]
MIRIKEILQWLPIPLMFMLGVMGGALAVPISFISMAIYISFLLVLHEEKNRIKKLIQLNEGEIRVLWSLDSHQKTVAEVSNETGYSWSGTKKILERLKDKGFVQENHKGMFFLTEQGLKLKEMKEFIRKI